MSAFPSIAITAKCNVMASPDNCRPSRLLDVANLYTNRRQLAIRGFSGKPGRHEQSSGGAGLDHLASPRTFLGLNMVSSPQAYHALTSM